MVALIQLISNNFEYLMLIMAGWLLLAVAVVVFVRLDDVTVSGIRRFGQLFLYYSVMGGLFGMMLLTGYVYWVNYERRNPVTLSDRILPDTSWVKGKFKIYFIEGHQLNSVYTDGLNKQTVFEAPDNIREYQFSPDGNYISVITDRELYLYVRRGARQILVDTLGDAEGFPDIKGALRSVSWSPDSTRIGYEISRQSELSSSLAYKIYDIKGNKHRAIKETLRTIPRLYWNTAGDKLYFTNYEALDTTHYQSRFEVRIFEVPLDTLEPRLFATVPSETAGLAAGYWGARGIELFDPGQARVFNRSVHRRYAWVSETGSRLGIDHDDQLYYIKGKWWRKRLFKIPREKIEGDYRNTYAPGPYAIRSVSWIPGGRYILLNHINEGILILEPATGKVGRISDADGYAFGWYDIDGE